MHSIDAVKVLTFRQMIFLGKGSFVRQLVHAFIVIVLRLFFRRIETANAEQVPKDGAIMFVLNHPNGLVDPALVFVSLARRVSFLAKSTLFQIPVGGWLLRTLEALPVYRRVDAAGDMSKNLKTFEVCRVLIAQGRCIAIFPEGVSHNETKLQPLKTGAARIALGAVSDKEKSPKSKVQSLKSENQSLDSEAAHSRFLIQDSKIEDQNPKSEDQNPNLKIMSVGLFYTSKTAFRSEVLIRYGEMFEVEPVELEADGEPPVEEVEKLTEKIGKSLRAATLNFESQTELDAVLKAEVLFSSVYENLLFKDTLTQTFHRLQDLAKKYELLEKNDPQKMRELEDRINIYQNSLKSSGVTAESLSVLQHPARYVLRYLILRIFVLIVLAPLAIAGAIVHSPAYLFSNLVGLIFKTHGADAAGSTYKILAACALMPLTWIIFALIILYFFGWQIALISIPLTILCGYIALRSSETLIDLSVWLKSVWLLLRRRALFLRLLVERETIRRKIGDIIKLDSRFKIPDS